MVARTFEVFLFLLLLGPVRSPVTGSRFSFSAVEARVVAWPGFSSKGDDMEVDVSDTAVAFTEARTGSLDGVSWNTVKLRKDILAMTGIQHEAGFKQEKKSGCPRAIRCDPGG